MNISIDFDCIFIMICIIVLLLIMYNLIYYFLYVPYCTNDQFYVDAGLWDDITSSITKTAGNAWDATGGKAVTAIKESADHGVLHDIGDTVEKGYKKAGDKIQKELDESIILHAIKESADHGVLHDVGEGAKKVADKAEKITREHGDIVGGIMTGVGGALSATGVGAVLGGPLMAAGVGVSGTSRGLQVAKNAKNRKHNCLEDLHKQRTDCTNECNNIKKAIEQLDEYKSDDITEEYNKNQQLIQNLEMLLTVESSNKSDSNKNNSNKNNIQEYVQQIKELENINDKLQPQMEINNELNKLNLDLNACNSKCQIIASNKSCDYSEHLGDIAKNSAKAIGATAINAAGALTGAGAAGILAEGGAAAKVATQLASGKGQKALKALKVAKEAID